MENAPRVNGEKTMNMATQPNSPDRTANKTSIVNRPYIRKETINTVVDRDGNDSMRMEEMPAGKSEEQIESERVGQKQREEQERVRKEKAMAEAEHQRILQEQREKVQNAYHRNTENELNEEQDNEMEMEM